MNKLSSSRSTKRCYKPNIKALHLQVSEKKNSEVRCLCFYVPNCDPRGWVSLDSMGIIIIYILVIGPLRDATYKISNSRPSTFREEEFRNLSFSVPMPELVNPTAGPVLTQGASYEQTW